MTCYSLISRSAALLKTSAGLSLLLLGALHIAGAEEPTKSFAPKTNAIETLQKPADKIADAEAAWKALQKEMKPPRPPAEWNTRKPTQEEVEAFNKESGAKAGELAEKVRAFYEQYPNHPKAQEAQRQELDLLRVAVQTGNEKFAGKLKTVEKGYEGSPAAAADEKIQARIREIQKAAQQRRQDGPDAMLEEFLKGAETLRKEFPNRTEPYEILLELIQIAQQNDKEEKARSLADDLIKSDAPEELKERAKLMFKRTEALNKELSIKFKAVDGRDVDLTKLKGKVVLIDFWATWCGPCVAEMPNVKKAYEKFHDKGFEIVGISLDDNKKALESFLKKHEIPWPQHLEPEGERNRFAAEFGVMAIPDMWLVDKKGIVRDQNARTDLEGKIEKLLAE